jgi:hypothetical protein
MQYMMRSGDELTVHEKGEACKPLKQLRGAQEDSFPTLGRRDG